MGTVLPQTNVLTAVPMPAIPYKIQLKVLNVLRGLVCVSSKRDDHLRDMVRTRTDRMTGKWVRSGRPGSYQGLDLGRKVNVSQLADFRVSQLCYRVNRHSIPSDESYIVQHAA